ncbi:putative structural protein [Pseudomonas phage vB_PaeM_kmuB]|nr:putative structural protein [Pseudomonas phage vB_PaeM_kmuB]
MQPYSNFSGLQQRTNNQIVIGSDMLAGTNKKGVLVPDADGYYLTPLGAYGTRNSAGMFYEMASGVSMFNPDSPLMRRVKKGVLFMEYKHPEPYRKDGTRMNEHEYLMRIRQIDDDRVCAHIKELILVDSTDEKGLPIKLVLGKCKPYGPFGKYFEASITNPSQNTYCSVRSITQDDPMRGIKYTREISTWDMVGEGGIYGANKWNSPALENYEDQLMVITPDTLYQVQRERERQINMGFECSDITNVTDLAKSLGWDISPVKHRRPGFMR